MVRIALVFIAAFAPLLKKPAAERLEHFRTFYSFQWGKRGIVRRSGEKSIVDQITNNNADSIRTFRSLETQNAVLSAQQRFLAM